MTPRVVPGPDATGGGPRPSARRRPSRAPAWGALALLMVVLTAGCTLSVPNPFERSGGPPQEIRLRVENQGFNDVRLFAVTVRGPQFIGQVSGHTNRTFTIPWTRLEEISIRMEFLAEDSYVTNRVNAAPGDLLELIIPRRAANATLRRR